jgi:methionine biosynthesis protein MetW
MEVEREAYEASWSRKRKETRIHKGLRRDVTARLVSGGERLLDVGCGDGTLAVLVKDKYRKVYGVDISAEAIERAKGRGVEAVRVNLNSETLPFKADYFDTVTCLDVIEHVFDPRVLIKEIYRVLRPESEGFISTPNIRFLRFLQSIILTGRFPKTSGDSTLYDGGHIHFFTFKDTEFLLQEAGLRVLAKRGLTSETAREQFKWRLLRAILGQTFEREFMCVEALVQFQKPAGGVGVG